MRFEWIELPFKVYVSGRRVCDNSMTHVVWRLTSKHEIDTEEAKLMLKELVTRAIHPANDGFGFFDGRIFLRPHGLDFDVDWYGRLDAEIWVGTNRGGVVRLSDWLVQHINKKLARKKAKVNE